MASPTTTPPVIVVQDCNDDIHKSKRARTSNDESNGNIRCSVFDPTSSYLLDTMLHPLSKSDFLKHHFRKDAVHISREQMSPHDTETLVSDICQNYLFGLNVRQIFEETSSENVFLWLRPPPPAAADGTTTSNHDGNKHPPPILNSVEISDPETAYALHRSGSHAAYCRAPPLLEQHLVGNVLRATGLGGGHYHPPHGETVTLGGNTTLGRGEVELFISAAASPDTSKERGKHTTGWHTDFQENFTIQLSGIKRWTLRRGRIRHPLRATTPHYGRDASVIENQLKVNRLACLGGNAESYGFEYDDNNAYGEEQIVTLYPGDVFYFPSGMWHRVESLEPGVSLNVSLMGTTYASLVCQSLEHLLSSKEDWREVVCTSGEDCTQRLQGLLGGLSRVVDDFVNKQGGANSLLPPALRYPPLMEQNDDESSNEDEGLSECNSNDEENQSNSGGTPTSGIIISIENFEGPPGWSCDRPHSDAILVKNPLASLIAMSDIVQNLKSSGDEDKQNASTKQYILNVNFAGNEMMESHIRVILEAESSSVNLIDQIDRYIKLDAEDQDKEHGFGDILPPPCLFYYGYFSWSSTQQPC